MAGKTSVDGPQVRKNTEGSTGGPQKNTGGFTGGPPPEAQKNTGTPEAERPEANRPDAKRPLRSPRGAYRVAWAKP